MAGFHLPGDPYFPNGGRNGWIEDHDPDTYEPEEDPSEQESHQETEPIEIEPEEDPSEHEPGHDYDVLEGSDDDDTEEVSESDDMMDIDESDGDSHGEGPAEVPVCHPSPDRSSEDTVDSPVFLDRREIIRSRNEPLPPPSSQIYRHPGGVRWRHTPRKRVPIPPWHDARQAPVPDPAVGYAPHRPEWVNRLRDWSFAQELPPPFALGQTTFDLGAGTIADRALPVTVGRIARMETYLTATQRDILDARLETVTATSRVRELAEDQRRHEHQTQELIDELTEAHEVITTLRAEQVGLRDRISMMDAHIADLSAQMEAVVRAAAETTERLNRHLRD